MNNPPSAAKMDVMSPLSPLLLSKFSQDIGSLKTLSLRWSLWREKSSASGFCPHNQHVSVHWLDTNEFKQQESSLGKVFKVYFEVLVWPLSCLILLKLWCLWAVTQRTANTLPGGRDSDWGAAQLLAILLLVHRLNTRIKSCYFVGFRGASWNNSCVPDRTVLYKEWVFSAYRCVHTEQSGKMQVWNSGHLTPSTNATLVT